MRCYEKTKDYSSTASGPLDVCNANSTVACDKIPSQGKAFGIIALGKAGGETPPLQMLLK